MTRLYVGHIPDNTTEVMLRNALEQDGRTVTHVNIKKNATTGKLRGFAFVDMGSPEQAEAAIVALQGTMLGGQAIKVNHAKDLPTRSTAEYHGSGNYHGGAKRGGRRY